MPPPMGDTQHHSGASLVAGRAAHAALWHPLPMPVQPWEHGEQRSFSVIRLMSLAPGMPR